MMNNHRAGDTITVTVYRGKQRKDIKVRLGDARETA
jgi:S1-C subfamily serine protease